MSQVNCGDNDREIVQFHLEVLERLSVEHRPDQIAYLKAGLQIFIAELFRENEKLKLILGILKKPKIE